VYSAKSYDSAYHSIQLDNVEYSGQRKPEKRLENVSFDFTDSIVLDIGCNQGGMLFQIRDKIKYGVGIDYDGHMINAANKICAYEKSTNLSFYTFDIEKEDLDVIINFLPVKNIDIVFLLSICMWIRNWKEVIDMSSKLSSILLFESNGSQEQQNQQENYLKNIFLKVDLLQDHSPDDPKQKNRKLYICYK